MREKKDCDRQRLEEALSRAIFDVAAEGVLVADLETLAIVSVNPAICRMLGTPREELLALRASDIRPVEGAGEAQAATAPIAATTPRAAAVPFLRRDGSTFYADVTSGTIEVEGRRWLVQFYSDVTERVRTEEALRAAERRYEDLFDHMSSCVAVYQAREAGEDFVFVSFNKAAEKAERITRAEVMGQSVLSVFPGVKAFGLFAILRRVWQTGLPESHPATEYRDGRVCGWRENYVYKLPSGEIVAVYDDVTTKKLAEAALRKSEEEYRLLVENASEAVFIAQDGSLRFANLATTRMLGRTAEDIAATPFAGLVHPDDRQGVIEQHIKMLAGETVQSDRVFRILTAAGRVRWVHVRAVRVDWEGRPATLNLGSDISEQKEAEDRVGRVLQETIRAVGRITERRDPYTSGHQERVAELACAIAREMGLADAVVDGLRVAALLHDVGKLGIPTETLTKPAVLTDADWSVIREHPQASYDIVKDIEFPWPVAETVLQHHERLDGSGYPRGLRGAEIIAEARILAVADTVEAMASHRPYRPTRGVDEALAEVAAGRARLFDAAAVDACLRLFREGRFAFCA